VIGLNLAIIYQWLYLAIDEITESRAKSDGKYLIKDN
jgi:hypothetical protein